jgi:hypothetical protein
MRIEITHLRDPKRLDGPTRNPDIPHANGELINEVSICSFEYAARPRPNLQGTSLREFNTFAAHAQISRMHPAINPADDHGSLPVWRKP